jgi:RNA polymerase primary sigma factor
VWWVRQAILHILSDQARVVSLPAKLSGPASRLAVRLAMLSKDLQRSPTPHEVAEDLDISDAEADALLRVCGGDISLSDRVGSNDDDERELADLLPQSGIPPVDEALVQAAALDQLRRALGELDAREREVMELRFGLRGDQPHTLQGIGDLLGLSRERVRQIESRAKERLRRNQRLSAARHTLN